MKTSARGRAEIARHEGVVLKSYRDSAGVLTIGIGHTSNAGPPVVRAGMKVDRPEAMAIFERDLGRYERRVAAALGPVTQHVFDGAVSFDFNTGAIHRASWVKAFRRGDMVAAEARLKIWNKAGGRVVNGLTRRRDAEADLIFRGKYRSRSLEDPAKVAIGTAGILVPTATTLAVASEQEPAEAGIVLAVVAIAAVLALLAVWRLAARSGANLKAEA